MSKVVELAHKSDEEGWAGTIIKHARMIASQEQEGSDLVGFLIVGVYSDGRHSAGFRWDPERSPIPRRLMPAWMEEVVREEMVTDSAAQHAACAVLNQGPI